MSVGPRADSDRFGIGAPPPPGAARAPVRAARLAWWAALYVTGGLPGRYRRGGWLRDFNAFLASEPGHAPNHFRSVAEFEVVRNQCAALFHRMKHTYPVPTTETDARARWRDPEARCHLYSFIARREQHPLRFVKWMRWLPWSGRLLEYGAGAAPLAHGLSVAWPLALPDVVVADVEWVLRDYCQWHFRHTRHVDVCDVDTVVGPFDGIVCTETLEHVPDPRATAEHLMSLLVSGGILIADYAEQTVDQPMAPRGLSARIATRNYLSRAGKLHQRNPFFVIEKW